MDNRDQLTFIDYFLALIYLLLIFALLVLALLTIILTLPICFFYLCYRLIQILFKNFFQRKRNSVSWLQKEIHLKSPYCPTGWLWQRQFILAPVASFVFWQLTFSVLSVKYSRSDNAEVKFWIRETSFWKNRWRYYLQDMSCCATKRTNISIGQRTNSLFTLQKCKQFQWWFFE